MKFINCLSRTLQKFYILFFELCYDSFNNVLIFGVFFEIFLTRRAVWCAVLYSQWSRWKDFTKLSFFFQILYNAFNFVLLFRRLNGFIVQLILFFVDYFWVFQCFGQCIGSFFSKVYIYFFSRPYFFQFFGYCCYSCRILWKIRRCVWMFFCISMSRQWKLLIFLMWGDLIYC